MSEEPSVLGNLPRSRPGQRSPRRQRDGSADAGPGDTAAARSGPARQSRATEPDEASADPISGSLRAAGQVAGAALGAASRAAGGVLGRLPKR